MGLLLLLLLEPQPQEEVRRHCYYQISCLWTDPELLLVQLLLQCRQRKFQQKERPLELLEPELALNHHQTRNLPSMELLEQRVHYHHQSQTLLVLGQGLLELELQRKAALWKVLPSSRLARVRGLQKRIHLHPQQQQLGLVLEYFQRKTPW